MSATKYTVTNTFNKPNPNLNLHLTGCNHLKRISSHDVVGSGDTVEEAYYWAMTCVDPDGDFAGKWKRRTAACAKEEAAKEETK